MKAITGKAIRSCLEQSHDGFMIANPDGIILYSNDSYRKLTKLYEKGSVGTNLKELLSQQAIDGSTCMECIKRKRTFTSVHRDYALDGVILSASKPLFDENGNIELVITNVRDTSEFFDLKHEIEIAQKAIADLTKSADELGFGDQKIVAVSPKMQATLKKAQKASGFDVSVLIQGPSGTGKEVVAKFIHQHSPRKDKPFIVINCGAIPETLMETELFGYAEGTFTGQKRSGKCGLLAAAKGGTLFLDEIGDMPLSMQVKLLRVLESNTYTPVGSTQQLNANVRFISATNRPLMEMVNQNLFREDLYYRLNVVEVTIDPLIDRKEDIIPLSIFFLEKFNRKYHLEKILPSNIIPALQGYPWTGNVRELKNVIETMTVLSSDRYLELPQNIQDNVIVQQPNDQPEWEVENLSDFVGKQEKSYLTYCYKKCGTTRKLAEALKVNHSTIMRKFKRYHICVHDCNS